MDPYNFHDLELEEEDQGYIHEPDLETCPVCWWSTGHEPGCRADIYVSIEDLEPALQGWFA